MTHQWKIEKNQWEGDIWICENCDLTILNGDCGGSIATPTQEVLEEECPKSE